MQRKACKRPIVLIVEDEVLVRWAVVSIVEKAGFDVVEAANAVEAMSVLEQRSDIAIVSPTFTCLDASTGFNLRIWSALGGRPSR